MRQKRPPIRLIALLVTLLFMCLPKIIQAGPLASPLISSYNPPFAQANTWDKLQTFSAGLTVSGGNLIAPTIIGGTGTTSTLTLQSTSGVGAAGADIIFKVGNNGATEAGRILNSGILQLTAGGLLLGSDDTLAWGDAVGGGTADTILTRLAANTLGMKNGTNSQELRVYHNATQYSDIDLYGIRLDGTGIQAENAGVFLNNFLILTLDNSNNTTIKTRGGDSIQPEADNTRDFGSTSRRIRSQYLGTSSILQGANGQQYVQGRATELVAVGSGISTKATTIQIPADAIVYAVPVYVKTKPGGTATMTVTATTSGTAFQKGANISTNAGTSDPGTKNTPINYNATAAQTVTFTFDVPTTDALGEIRVDIYYATSTPPTS